MEIKDIIKELTLDEKIKIIYEEPDGIHCHGIERLGINEKLTSDGPHGLRLVAGKNSTLLPNLCQVAASWDPEAAGLMGDTIANDCIEHKIDMVYGPGLNIKRTPLCGRNFEYFSEDPVLSGEMTTGVVKGMQEKGIGACIKHFAANNQEKYRHFISAEIDERTLREIYLKGFEIAVKKAIPWAIMCSYNKLNGVYTSENKQLLTDILRKEWDYDGFVVSDYGAVHDTIKAIRAGLDLHMPAGADFEKKIKDALASGELTEEELDKAVLNLLKFFIRKRPEKRAYDRDAQHETAVKVAEAGMVLLKNDRDVLPITKEKYKKIVILGEYADNPLIAGQGSAAVFPDAEYIDSPLKELRKNLPDVEITYHETFKRSSFAEEMLWPEVYTEEFKNLISGADLAIVFAGSMTSEDTEKFDRRSIELSPVMEMFIGFVSEYNKNVVVVLQNGSALAFGDWHKQVPGIVEMYLAGEGAGKAVANVLCGKVNPSGKLPETFPTKLRTDMDYPGDGLKVEYNEKLNVGYRYYDKHPEEICYPFGHGLSYTDFSYGTPSCEKTEDGFCVSFTLKNTGKVAGAEVVQLYVADPVTTVTKAEKDLKQFKKVYLEAGEEKEITFLLKEDDFSYYNVSLHQWVIENGEYQILIGSSSRDIRQTVTLEYSEKMPYTPLHSGATTGDIASCYVG